MRPTTLLHAFALFAFTVITTVVALPSGDGDAVARGDAAPIVEARSPTPSPAIRKRGPQKRKQRVLTEEERMSQYLCPLSLTVCPLSEDSRPTTVLEWTREGFECVDIHQDLYSCGGCSTMDIDYDCTQIEGANNVACVVGACRVHSCLPGYTRSLDGTSCIDKY